MSARRTRRYSGGMRTRRMSQKIRKHTWNKKYAAFLTPGAVDFQAEYTARQAARKAAGKKVGRGW